MNKKEGNDYNDKQRLPTQQICGVTRTVTGCIDSEKLVSAITGEVGQLSAI